MQVIEPNALTKTISIKIRLYCIFVTLFIHIFSKFWRHKWLTSDTLVSTETHKKVSGKQIDFWGIRLCCPKYFFKYMYGIQYYHSHVCPFLFMFNDTCTNINGRDVQRKNVVNNVDMSSLRAPWQNGPYKN